MSLMSMFADDQPSRTPPLTVQQQGINLVLVGFLVLFLELACIRWFAFSVVFLQFFTNVILLACFLGMSCGCLAARQSRDWLALFPFIALAAAAGAVGIQFAFNHWAGLAIDVGHQSSPQEVFFGTEYRNPDVARFTVPIEWVMAGFFIFIAFMFVGLGQVLGRAFDAYPHRIRGYTLNIGGSLVGILGFSVLSFAHTPPIIWFLIGCAGIAYLLYQSGRLTRPRGLALLAFLLLIAAPLIRTNPGIETRWSPYYAVVHDKASGIINVNGIGHQAMVPFTKAGSSYSLIHLLQKDTGGKPFQDVLIIGAGSGNDVAHALRHGVGQIDAVEIDPVIQDIGIRDHPDRPYQDPRVVRHIDDGRHFLRTTDRKYDLVVYALVDSLILHSSYANVRLESFLFTEEAFADIQRVLKPGGIFVMYNAYRQGWIVERVAAVAEKVFGCAPTVLSFPYAATLTPSSPTGFNALIVDCTGRIAGAFRQHDVFWLNRVPLLNQAVNGFDMDPGLLPPEQRTDWQKIAPTTLVHDAALPLIATDDWPFLYLRGRVIPDLNIRSIVILGMLGVAMVCFFLPKGRLQVDTRMFFLGAGFMLLETKAVVQMALLFGNTWLVNSLVFFTVLILILLANLYVLTMPSVRLARHYAGLICFLVASILAPLDIFLGGGVLWRYVVPCVLALGPMFFAGVIFARQFRDVRDPDQALGSNIAGSVLGGLSEALCMLLGFRHLLLLAVLFYALSIWVPSYRAVRAAAT
jgi:SAM-dependent methyltransferase